MDCFYINLDDAYNRKINLEDQFFAYNRENWFLNRFPAIGITDIQDVPGNITDAEKACFLSHKTLICSLHDNQDHVFILEDDCLFGSMSNHIVDSLIKNLDNNVEWDLLFTDICIPRIEDMLSLMQLRGKLVNEQFVKLLELKNYVFAGSTAYIVNKNSISKFSSILKEYKQYDRPYDLFLRGLICEDKLKAFVTFPFVTSLSDESEVTQIQREKSDIEKYDNADFIWNTFRKTIWLERNLQKIKCNINELYNIYSSDEMNSYSAIITAMLSDKYQPK